MYMYDYVQVLYMYMYMYNVLYMINKLLKLTFNTM